MERSVKMHSRPFARLSAPHAVQSINISNSFACLRQLIRQPKENRQSGPIPINAKHFEYSITTQSIVGYIRIQTKEERNNKKLLLIKIIFRTMRLLPLVSLGVPLITYQGSRLYISSDEGRPSLQ